jgi:uncharacterized protein YndB with AHSA1/START domain
MLISGPQTHEEDAVSEVQILKRRETMPDIKPANDRELVLTRLLDAPRDKLFRCWTEPALIKQWFAPKPFTTPVAEIDLRPGGVSRIVMRSPEGQDMDNPGQYLEVVKNEKLVFTDAFAGNWTPKEGAPFMVAEITFADEGGKTRYTARAKHWTKEAREQHEAMGFHTGWGLCADQLEALAKTL